MFNKKVLVGALVVIAGGVTAKTVQIIRNRKQESAEEIVEEIVEEEVVIEDESGN